jgi:hypothetical protein
MAGVNPGDGHLGFTLLLPPPLLLLLPLLALLYMRPMQEMQEMRAGSQAKT